MAKERIVPGQVILEDRPYSSVLIPSMQEGRQDTEKGVFGTEHRCCHRCLTETLCAVACEGCSYSRYCSAGCKKEAWEEHHCWECPLGSDLMAMGVMAQLALRVTLKAGLKNVTMANEPVRDKNTMSGSSCSNSESGDRHINQPNSSLYYGDSYPSVFHLLHHLNSHSPGLCFLCAVTIATLYRKLSRAGPPPSSWDLSTPSGATSQSPGRDDAEEGVTDWSVELWPLGSAAFRHMLQLRCNAQAILMLQDIGDTCNIKV